VDVGGHLAPTARHEREEFILAHPRFDSEQGGNRPAADPVLEVTALAELGIEGPSLSDDLCRGGTRLGTGASGASGPTSPRRSISFSR
jgi:hypothetical protein